MPEKKKSNYGKYSDFTVGFKQGQEHGKQIILEKVKDAFEEMTCLQMGTIATMLADISKSLAMIADIKSSELEKTRKHSDY